MNSMDADKILHAKSIIDSVRADRQRSFEAGILERALEVIAGEIYSKDEHFILELLQNADDNTYGETICPTLRFLVSDHSLLVTCNEVGMTKADVESICDVARSAKKQRATCIGEKGLGFKSVFMCTSQPHIYSNGFSFKLAKPTFIVPEWVSKFPVAVDPTATTLYLPFNIANQWDTKLFDILEPSALLFLRRLREIFLCLDIPSKLPRNLVLSKKVTGCVTTITSADDVMGNTQKTSMDFLIVSKEFNVPERAFDERRKHFAKTEVSCAFKLSGTGTALPDPASSFFSFLPVRKSGLPFILQANFILTANREDLDHASPWNCWLRTAAVDTFLSAVDEHFKAKAVLGHSFYACLPLAQGVPHDFFRVFSEELFIRLRNHSCVQGCSGNWLQPCDILIPFAQARGVFDTMLVANALGLEFIDESVNMREYGNVLRLLGCRQMERKDVIQCLSHTSCQASHHQRSSWHLRLYDFLAAIFKGASHELQGLPIIPLSATKTVSMASGHTVFFRGTDIPTPFAQLEEELGLNILQKQATPADGTPALGLLQDLGVQKLSPSAVVLHHILPIYDTDISLIAPDALLAHVRYITEVLRSGLKQSKFKAVVEACKKRILLRGSDDAYHSPSALYVQSPCLEQLLGKSALYLHAQYDCMGNEALALLGVSRTLRFEMRSRNIPRRQRDSLTSSHGFVNLPDTHQGYILEELDLPEYVLDRAAQDPDVTFALVEHLDDEWASFAEEIKPRVRSFFRGSAGQCCPNHNLKTCDSEECSSCTRTSQPGCLQVIESTKQCNIRTRDGTIHLVGDCQLQSKQLLRFFGSSLNYLPVQLKSDEFIAALGFCIDVTCEMLLKFLQSLSRNHPRYVDGEKLDLVRKVYQKIDIDFAEEAETLVEQFHECHLVLWHHPVPDCVPGDRIPVQWLPPSEVRWEADDSGHAEHYSKDVCFLQPIYGPELASFFCSKLSVPRTPTFTDRLHMLHDLAHWSSWGEWSDSAQQRVEFLYKELSRDCRRLEATWKKTRPGSHLQDHIDIPDLKKQRIFRTCSGHWSSAVSGLHIPDNDDLFRDLQNTPVARSIINTSPRESHFLNKLAEALEINFLSGSINQHVSEKSALNSQCNGQWSQHLRCILEPAVRCVYHAWSEQHDEDHCDSHQAFITKLAEEWQGLAATVTCHIVDELEITYRLPNFVGRSFQRTCEAFPDVHHNRIFISEQLAKKTNVEICPILASQVVRLLENGVLASSRREMVEMQVYMLLMTAQSAADVSVIFDTSPVMKCIVPLPHELSLALSFGGTASQSTNSRTVNLNPEMASQADSDVRQHGDSGWYHGSCSRPPWGTLQTDNENVDQGTDRGLQADRHTMKMRSDWQSANMAQHWFASSFVSDGSQDSLPTSSVSAHYSQTGVRRWSRQNGSHLFGLEYSKVDTEFPGIFWLVFQSEDSPILCIDNALQHVPEPIWCNAHNLMVRLLGHSEISFEKNAQKDKLNTALQASMDEGTYWKSCSAFFREGGIFQGVGIGRNKKVIERAAKLALALTVACQQGSQLDAGLPEAFRDCAESLSNSLQCHRSPSENGSRASSSSVPMKRAASTSFPSTAKRFRQDASVLENDNNPDVHVVEEELSAIMSGTGSDSEDIEPASPAIEEAHEFAVQRTASALRSCLAQGLVEITQCLATRPFPRPDNKYVGISTVAAILQETPTLRASLRRATSRYFQEANQLYDVARRIYKQNHGPQALLGQCPEIVNFEERSIQVSDLRYTHGSISPNFLHGDHAGEPVSRLIEQLNAGQISVSELPHIVVAPFDGKFYAVTGNRRLHALKCHAEHIKQNILIKVQAVRHLCPITAKFLMSFSTTTAGESVQVRAS